MADSEALRAVVSGRVQGVGFRERTRVAARELDLRGWVRNEDDGSVRVHAEGAPAALDELTAFLRAGPPAAQVRDVEVVWVSVEGHEQFAIRSVSAGAFVVSALRERGRRFELALEVDGAMRRWELPREPSLRPREKRLAIPVEGETATDADVWDSGSYEQGGRVPWPEALARGHAVFVLHGRRLRGGFALQRLRDEAGSPWLLVKRRDEHAA